VEDVPHDGPSNNLECFTIKTHVTKSVSRSIFMNVNLCITTAGTSRHAGVSKVCAGVQVMYVWKSPKPVLDKREVFQPLKLHLYHFPLFLSIEIASPGMKSTDSSE